MSEGSGSASAQARCTASRPASHVLWRARRRGARRPASNSTGRARPRTRPSSPRPARGRSGRGHCLGSRRLSKCGGPQRPALISWSGRPRTSWQEPAAASGQQARLPRRHGRRVGSTRPREQRTSPRTGSSHVPSCAGVDQPDSIRPRARCRSSPAATEVEEHGAGVVQQGEHARRTVGGLAGRDRACAGRAAGVPPRGRSGCRDRRASRRCAGAARPCPAVRSSCRAAPGDDRRAGSSATCAMVLCNTRAPTGCRSAW